MPEHDHILPDLIRPGLRLVFCGTAPGTVSAQRGAYYAHPQNKFWRVLHAVKLTPRLFAPEEYRLLDQLGIGLTDIAKQFFGMDRELPRGALRGDAIEALRERIRKAAPQRLAFTSLTGGRRAMGPKAGFGRQPEKIGETEVWILHSPSPTANWNWDDRHWRALARAVNATSRR